MDTVLELLSILCVIAAVVLFILFIVRWIRKNANCGLGSPPILFNRRRNSCRGWFAALAAQYDSGRKGGIRAKIRTGSGRTTAC